MADADDGTRWSHTSGEAEELNVSCRTKLDIRSEWLLTPLQKLTQAYEIVKSSGDNARKDRQERRRRKEEEEREREHKKKDEGKKDKDGKGK